MRETGRQAVPVHVVRQERRTPESNDAEAAQRRNSSRRLKGAPSRHLSLRTDIYPGLFANSLSQGFDTSCPTARHSVCVLNVVAHRPHIPGPCSASLPSRRSPSNGSAAASSIQLGRNTGFHANGLKKHNGLGKKHDGLSTWRASVRKWDPTPRTSVLPYAECRNCELMLGSFRKRERWITASLGIRGDRHGATAVSGGEL